MDEIKYCLGFMIHINQRVDRVLLIRKTRPEWQRGKMNGLGGKIEPGETAIQAMVREFEEECGIKTKESDWKERLVLKGKYGQSWTVEVFVSFTGNMIYDTLTFPDIEKVSFSDLATRSDIIHNVRWMVPFCIDSAAQPITVNY